MRVSLSLELTQFTTEFHFLFKQLSTNYLDEYLGHSLVLGWWLLHGVTDCVMLSAVLCEVPFLGAVQCFYTFLYQRFIMTCFRLYYENMSCFGKFKLLFGQPLDHYLKLFKVPSETAVFPTDGNFDKLALCYIYPPNFINYFW